MLGMQAAYGRSEWHARNVRHASRRDSSAWHAWSLNVWTERNLVNPAEHDKVTNLGNRNP